MRRQHPRGHGSGSFLSAALLLTTCCVLLMPQRTAASDVERADALKAAYLFNFMKFVEWPGPSTEALTVCFFGGAGVHDGLAAVFPEKRIDGRALEAKRLAQGESFAGCEVLYIEAAQLRALPAGNPLPAVLTVSDSADYLRSGGIIELFAEGNRLRFRISLANAHRAGLRISSMLLRLASSVEKEQ